MSISHNEKVDIKHIKAEFDTERKNRYLLEVPFYIIEETRDQILSIILKNPSKANETIADVTIQKAEAYIYRHFPDVAKINFLNLYPLMATDTSDLQEYLKTENKKKIEQELKKNNLAIQTAIESSSSIIMAWGGNSKIEKKPYDKRIEEVKAIIRTLQANTQAKIYRITKNNYLSEYPRHAQMWGYDIKKFPFIEVEV